MSNNSSTTSSQQVAPAYRLPQSRGSRTPASASDRSRSHLSREASEQSLPPMSTFLQERLERERRVESERSLSRASNEAMSASGDVRAVQSSPARSKHNDSRRPGSSDGNVDPAPKKKGLGLKEMEQTLSTLHKQNFDLKLELFHRRERQSGMEERLEKLENEKAQTDEMNDQLIQELEKRDKAVEEAVAMIVVLEARVEQLLREREMVRQVEQEGLFYAQSDSNSNSTGSPPTPRMQKLELPTLDNAKVLNRMPSFLSEQSENTENLRNVYLGVRGSVLSLPRMNEDSPDTDRSAHNGVHSPTLSVLSESSFMSIYGQREVGGRSPSPPNHGSPGTDGPAKNRGAPMLGSSSTVMSVTPTRPRQPSDYQDDGNNRYQNLNDVLDLGGSPLQRLEKLEMTLSAMNQASRPSTSAQEKEQSHSARSAPLHTQPKTKQEKRDALQRVLTQGQLGRESHALPPTPDTISTSTLRRYQNSDSSLSKELSLANERSYLALSETTASQTSGYDGSSRRPDLRDQASRTASTTAFDSRKQLPDNGPSFDTHFNMSQPRRPRSTSETTLSHRRNDWDSESSDDEFGNDANSVASSLDPWLKESLKPNRDGALNPMNSASQAGLGSNSGRISPDLFSFPVGSTGWATNAMFGTLGGSGYMGATGPSTSPSLMADALDALGDSLSTPLFGSGLVTPVLGSSNPAPPPPDRRSSLHARTGSTSVLNGAGSVPPSPARPSPMSSRFKKSPARGNRTRSNSIDAQPPLAQPALSSEQALRQNRAKTVPPKQLHLPPPSQSHEAQEKSQVLPKQRHYPPTASQAPRSRGLNNLFRRSTGSAEAPQLPAPSIASPTDTSFKTAPVQPVGVPSWGMRGSFADDDRASATPPPIQRNKGPMRVDNDDGGAPLEPPGGGGAPIGNIPGPESSAPAPTGGGKRKWLGLGRVGSLRNRGA
ncbi:hypothetical protein B0H63DRAFT_392332 [Podospora didyma]|uniref:Centrosomin N-terminal motif 1 domain-containing protein n=1 Tax=Podospora didyma TaxID=330526 RepID=A0AAE0NSE6_9PEZI|nr:hypothetical protein B0H63DRAFT_392332 [Podospora didyma]